MISAWCIHLLEVLGHFVVWYEVIEQVMLMTTNLINPDYTYSRLILHNPPVIVSTLTHFCNIVTWTPSRLSLYLSL